MRQLSITSLIVGTLLITACSNGPSATDIEKALGHTVDISKVDCEKTSERIYYCKANVKAGYIEREDMPLGSFQKIDGEWKYY